MRRRVMLFLPALIAFGLLAVPDGPPAKADPSFKKEFDVKYVKKDSSDPMDMAFAAKVKKARCNVCHVGKNRKMRNAYGKELSKLLDRKKDRRNKEKIQMALETVAALKSNPDDENAPTFGDLFAQGDLPASEAVAGQ